MASSIDKSGVFGEQGKRRGDCTGNGRIVPMQILVLGMCRTGTMSMTEALTTLGYKTYHMRNVFVNPEDIAHWHKAFDAKYLDNRPWTGKEWDDLLGESSAVLDVPVVLFAEELIATYPDAKIILTNRSVDSWHKSCSDTVFKVTTHPAVRVLKYLDPSFLGPWVKLIHRIWLALGDGDLGEGVKRGYLEHYEKVRRIAPKDRFLEFEVAKDDWAKLATFLEKPVPSGPFPKVNDTATFQRNINFVILNVAKRAAWNVGKMLSLVGVPALGVWWMSKRFT